MYNNYFKLRNSSKVRANKFLIEEVPVQIFEGRFVVTRKFDYLLLKLEGLQYTTHVLISLLLVWILMTTLSIESVGIEAITFVWTSCLPQNEMKLNSRSKNLRDMTSTLWQLKSVMVAVVIHAARELLKIEYYFIR